MKKINTRKALNPAYRKHKPVRNEVTLFINSLKECLEAIKISDEKNEHEEHIKEPIKKFFQSTFYQDNLINTKDRIDLAIYLDKTANSDIGVIIEAKRPSNKTEFITETNLNKKALQELLLYYLRERIDAKNNNIKHLIATNGYEWFLFKAEDFYDLFYKNKKLIKEYEEFRDGLKDTSKNELFYNEIAKKYIDEVKEQIPFVYIDFNNVDFSTLDDNTLNTYYKIFSNVHLLGHSFGNDSNSLNKHFYHELLHIIGLEEVSQGSKKVIQRKDINTRDYASLLENTIFTLEDRDYLRNVKTVENTPEKPFNVGLELCLTWINRILFLKLLESQLATYHKGAKEYKFLNTGFIDGFDELNNLFFSALAKNIEERHPRYAEKFKYIPYLNSSLFERNDLEDETFEISALKDDEMEVYSNTVLKDTTNKRFKGKLKTLDYLFKFLEAYDFATDGTEGITEGTETKTLINASVLGLIFEKINGYKDGSFYTPAYITMYMCKETIRRAVTQKFKEQENESIETFEDLKAYCHRFFKVEDTKRFNAIINSLRICDPAVGSGHFLVSALNELISIKNDLGVLVDEKGFPLRVDVQIDNDELYITDANGNLFVYNPNDAESTRIQKTLFEEKQTLIENCLFGVDINPNSVKICRLRLWVELLKNAYYTEKKQLHTLPNIDINIKCGNSLISRFDLQDDLKDAFRGKEVKYTFADYKKAVADYKNSNTKQQKWEVLAIINEVKNSFKSTLDKNIIDKVQKAIGVYENEKQRLSNLELFGEKPKKAEKDELKKLKTKADKALEEKENIINNVIFNNAFEWRFEFPEVLNDEGDFVGFDVVIGNPPYVQLQSIKEMSKQYEKFGFNTYSSMGDLYALFYEKGNTILRREGYLCFITGSAWMRANYGKQLREYLKNYANILDLIDFSDCEIFDSATVLTNILTLNKTSNKSVCKGIRFTRKDQQRLGELKEIFKNEAIEIKEFPENAWIISEKSTFLIKNKVESQGVVLKDWNVKINRGILTGLNEAFIIDGKTKDLIIKDDPKAIDIIKPLLRGRDIKKYHYENPDLWLISTFPSKNIDIMEYPSIKKYLETFGESLQQNGAKGSRKKTNGKWFETQDSISYWKDFEKSKIIYPNMTKFLPFVYDESKFYTNQKCFLITGNNLKFLTSFFNSKLFRFCFEENFPELQGNTRELNKVIFEQIPVKLIEEKEQEPFNLIVDQILSLKKENPEADTSHLEKEIDFMVYALYGLTKEEIEIVEAS